MRVALNGWFWNRPETGSGQYLRCLTHALSAYAPETEFLIILPSGNAPKNYPSNTHFIVQPVKYTALNKVCWEQVITPRIAYDYHADLLHIPYWAPPLLCKLPTIVTVHDLIPLLLPEYRGNVLVRLYTSFVSAASTRATIVLTDSHSSRRDIQQHLQVQGKRLRAIHLAVDDIYKSDPNPLDKSILEELGIQPGYILYLGGFDRRKNLAAVISAFRIVKRVCSDVVLVIAGKLPLYDNRFTPDPRRLSAEAGLTDDDVIYLGFVPESAKPALYRGARLFVFPSEYEGFGLPPLEALSCGVPVVGSHSSSLTEVISDAGVLLPPSDSQGMAGAMIQILTDDIYYQDLKARALQQSSHFSWKKTAQQTFDAYQQAFNTQN